MSDPTPVEECMVPTPEQVLYRWENYSDEQRHQAAGRYLEASAAASRCLTLDHEGAMKWARTHTCQRSESAEIESLQGVVAELRADNLNLLRQLAVADGALRQIARETIDREAVT